MGECKHQLTILYFFSLGLWTFCCGEGFVIYGAIEDLLAGTLWSSTVILIIYSIPDVITRVLSPYVINRISFRSAFSLLTLLIVGSFLLVVIIDDLRIRMIGVGVLGTAFGFGIITCVRTLSYYENADVLANAFQNGCNIASIVVSLIYTGMTTWICLAPRIALAICIPFGFLPLVFYLLLDKEPLKDHLKKTKDHQSVKYTALNEDDHSTDDESATQTSEQISMLSFTFKVFSYTGYAYLTTFCYQTILAAVITTLTFKSSPFQPRDHYQYYRLINHIGLSFGGSVHLLFSCLGSTKWIEYLRIRRIWVLGLSDVFHLVFLVLASWYRFLPNVTIVLVLCLTQGITNGLMKVTIASNLMNELSMASARDKGTALSLIQLAQCVGRIAAALLGIPMEKLLREHCTNRLMLGRFCLARPASHAEWNTNLCKKSFNF